MADWDADQYLKFEGERTRPALDLLRRVPLSRVASCVDIGCGPGNSTELLAGQFPDAEIAGIDSSPTMIEKARKRLARFSFEVCDIQTWAPRKPLDLIFANAVMQWIPRHEELLERLVSFLNRGGCLAVQMPNNWSEPSHRLMTQIAGEAAWASRLSSVSAIKTPIAPLEVYYSCLHQTGCSVDIWRTTYVHPLDGAEAIVEWFKSTGLKPYLDLLTPGERSAYLRRYREEIEKAYPSQVDGKVLLRFQRLFFVAQRR